MILSIVLLTVIGTVSGFGLAVASKKFFVLKDPRIDEVLNSLPGTNCGACGNPGCGAMAVAIVGGGMQPNECPSISEEMLTAIGGIMGQTVEMKERSVPRLICGGDREICPPTAIYNGVQDCAVMTTISGGGKPCVYGCLGGGSCVQACEYDAIHMTRYGLPRVDTVKCISCGMCVKACPRSLLVFKPISKRVVVECASKDKGADVRKICSKGCIGCKLCEKTCPEQAITVENSLSVIDHSKCTTCGKCIEKCPTKAIDLV